MLWIRAIWESKQRGNGSFVVLGEDAHKTGHAGKDVEEGVLLQAADAHMSWSLRTFNLKIKTALSIFGAEVPKKTVEGLRKQLEAVSQEKIEQNTNVLKI